MDQNNVQLQVTETVTLSQEREKPQLFGFVNEKTPKFINHYKHLNTLNIKQSRQFIAGWLASVFSNFDFFLGCFIILDLQVEFNVRFAYLGINITLASILRVFGSLIFRHLTHLASNRLLILFITLLLAIMYTIASQVGTFYGYSIVRGITSLLCGGLAEMGTLLIADDLNEYNSYIYSSLAGLAGAISYMLVPFYIWVFQEGNQWRYLFLIGIIIIIGVAFLMLWSIEEDLDKKSFKHNFSEGGNGKATGRSFGSFIYTVVLSFAWNVIARGTQDIYPTLVRTDPATTFEYAMLASFLAGFGALVGGLLIGIFTPFIGHQRSLLLALALFFVSYMIVNYAPASPRMTAGCVFFVQLFIQVAFNILPFHFTKCFHPEDRAIAPMVANMVGICLAAFSFQIETSIGEYYPNAQGGNQGGLVQFYLMMIASALCLLCSIVGGWNVYPDAPSISATKPLDQFDQQTTEVTEVTDPKSAV